MRRALGARLPALRRAGLAALALAALLALTLVANTAVQLSPWRPSVDTPQERADRLAPHWRLTRPPGEGAAPVALLLSGCDGPADNMALWAEALARLGWASLVVDSHAPRGLAAEPRWWLVCSGQALSGAERAGDAAVALAALRGMEGVDASRVLLLGASHGGWAAAELMALAEAGAAPPGLTAWPAAPETLLAQVAGVVLLYPYCGPASGAGTGWDHPAPVLMVLAGRDEIVGTEPCVALAGTLAGRGVPARAETLAEAGHGFDQRARSPLSPLDFDEGATRRAVALMAGLLRSMEAIASPDKP